MARINRHQLFMGIARLASQRATCFRLNVGAVVVQNNNPIALGYNGQRPGENHCQGNECPGIVPGNCGTFHAEVNALTKASTLLASNLGVGIWPTEVDLYCTDSPCGYCTTFILENTPLRVTRIFYGTPYRDTSHLGRFFGIAEVYQITPAGYIVDHFTRKVIELP